MYKFKRKYLKYISVIGLGVVGSATAIGFSKLNYNVVGVDIVKNKRDKINRLNNKRLNVTSMLDDAILNSEVSFVCVETPTKKNGEIDLRPLIKISKDISEILKNKRYHLIVFRSTMFPGSLEILKDVLEKHSNKKIGIDFDVAINPEFLREKHALKDFFKPSMIIVGSYDSRVSKMVLDYYIKIKARKFIVGENTAQMIKYVNNSFHALKVVFTNEIATLCKPFNIDSHSLMKLFCADKYLNISTKYFIPGKAYGGMCLSKDLEVLQKRFKDLNITYPVIENISKSNKEQIKRDRR